MPRTLALCAAAWKSLGLAWPQAGGGGGESENDSSRYWDCIIAKYKGSIWNVQQAILESMKMVFEKFDKETLKAERSVELFRVILDHEVLVKYDSLFTLSISLLDKMISSLFVDGDSLLLCRDHAKIVESESKSSKIKGSVEKLIQKIDKLSGTLPPPSKRSKMEES